MARACIEGPPRDETNQALAAFGIEAAGDTRPQQPATVEVWPEHERPLLIFQAMQTQWRVGVAGITGLDYSVLAFVAQQLGFSDKQLRKAFPVVRMMESEALALAAERRNKD